MLTDRYFPDKMKVLFVTRGFPSDNNVMDGNYEAGQAKALAAKGCQVSVVSIKLKSILHLFSRGKISHRKVDGVDVYLCTRIRFSTRYWSTPKLNERVAIRAYNQVFMQYVKEKGMPDVVHSHSIFCAAPVAFLKEKYHLPFVITEHWSGMFTTSVSEWQKEKSFIYHKADRVICVSQALADTLKRNYGIESIVINNMVNDLFFQNGKNYRNDDNFRFVACGALRKDRYKGFDLLVDAFALAHFPANVSLDIVGDGPDRSFIESKIAQYGLYSQIHLLGTKTPDEVSNLLNHSDCFVLSSRLETFSIVVIEAMAKGIPVIATRSGGPETFLRPEHGILVEKENVTELSEAMKYMTDHHQEYDSENIRQFCHDHFSQDVIANQILSVYNQLLNQKTN